jgi:hypothetical protein
MLLLDHNIVLLPQYVESIIDILFPDISLINEMVLINSSDAV